ncbi:DUF192 domain-containing protein [Candidatus Woesearchaeota archaeon]|nr:DUF192 domain-containing protein [Candidatus Woesearchaeota archaeon]
MRWLTFFLLFFFLLISCSQQINSQYAIIHDLKIPLELAVTNEERSKGLMFRESLEGGMLFIFEKKESLYFWMKNTKIPLDIIFLDDSYKIVDLKQNFQACTTEKCEVYESKPAKYVLEVNAGLVKDNNIRLGDRLDLFLKE